MGVSCLELNLEKERILLVGKEDEWQKSSLEGMAGIFHLQETTAINNGSSMSVANQKYRLLQSVSPSPPRDRESFLEQRSHPLTLQHTTRTVATIQFADHELAVHFLLTLAQTIQLFTSLEPLFPFWLPLRKMPTCFSPASLCKTSAFVQFYQALAASQFDFKEPARLASWPFLDYCGTISSNTG